MTENGRSRGRRAAAGVCLLVPVAALLWVPGYAREEPRLAGVPFFYWYQLVWVPGCVLGLLAARLLTRRRSGGGPAGPLNPPSS
ncbi:DUF3311 domain-containing protein [Streptomyces sp. CAU 1734]|uniref:DUF3311 domain-containing protein n=1 Tax=Streptomyces sp. CAU 1734 TaxID=3140360 RepID=UPI0032607010